MLAADTLALTWCCRTLRIADHLVAEELRVDPSTDVHG
jgi:hypothetical protein